MVSLTAEHINGYSLTAEHINGYSLTAEHINCYSLTAEHINCYSLTAEHINFLMGLHRAVPKDILGSTYRGTDKCQCRQSI